MGTLSIANFFLVNGFDLQARVTWNPADPADSAGAKLTGVDPSSGRDWTAVNGGIAFLDLYRDGSSLRFETCGTDKNGSRTAADIDIFTLPVDLTKAFSGPMQMVSPHIPRWTYVLRPLPDNPNGFLLVAGKSAALLTIKDFFYHNRVRLHAVVQWDPAFPGHSAGAQMTGKNADGVSWMAINGGTAFLDIFREVTSLRFETWGTDTNGRRTAADIDIFNLPIDLGKAFPGTMQMVSPRMPGWTYVLTPIVGNPNGFNLDANYDTVVAPGNVRVSTT